MTGKWVYGFADGATEGDAAMVELLGGKGANLAEMCSLGLPNRFLSPASSRILRRRASSSPRPRLCR